MVSFRIPTNNKENEKIKNEEKSKLASEIEKTIKNLINDNKVVFECFKKFSFVQSICNRIECFIQRAKFLW